MKKIVSVIYSFENVEQVVDYSIKLARDLNRELEFIHATELKNGVWDSTITNYHTLSNVSEGDENVLVKERERILNKVLYVKKASLDYNYPVHFKVVSGAVLVINKILSQRDDVEMIIVPYSSKNKMDVFISKLIDDLSFPVFAFPVEEEYHKIRNIVYASDYQKEDLSILKKVGRMAKRLVASVTVFHVRESKEFDAELKKIGLQELIKQKINLKSFRFEEDESSNSIEGIKKITQKSYADLVILLKKNKNLFHEIFGKSTTREILHDIHVPVLIYHE